jgi:syntaxin 5
MGSDRTNEFFTTIKLMENKPQYMNSELRQRKLQAANTTGAAAAAAANQQYSHFMRGAKSVSKELCSTYQKLEHLNELARKRTLFDAEDTNRQLNELIYIIKRSIGSLNAQIEQLRASQADGGSSYGSKNIESHSKNVVLNLQQRLATMSGDFKCALETRTANMAEQRVREQQFSRSSPALNSSTGPFSIQSTSGSQLTNRNTNTVIDFGEADGSAQYQQQSQQQMQTQKQAVLFDTTNEYMEERANTMHSVEATIVELGTIFTQLATMVQQQEEMITRIDSNVADASLNVEAAHESLLRYFNSISSNRWLMIKIFGVLFAFFMLFVTFA